VYRVYATVRIECKCTKPFIVDHVSCCSAGTRVYIALSLKTRLAVRADCPVNSEPLLDVLSCDMRFYTPTEHQEICNRLLGRRGRVIQQSFWVCSCHSHAELPLVIINVDLFLLRARPAPAHPLLQFNRAASLLEQPIG
jgi:hypothetical protein